MALEVQGIRLLAPFPGPPLGRLSARREDHPDPRRTGAGGDAAIRPVHASTRATRRPCHPALPATPDPPPGAQPRHRAATGPRRPPARVRRPRPPAEPAGTLRDDLGERAGRGPLRRGRASARGGLAAEARLLP